MQFDESRVIALGEIQLSSCESEGFQYGRGGPGYPLEVNVGEFEVAKRTGGRHETCNQSGGGDSVRVVVGIIDDRGKINIQTLPALCRVTEYSSVRQEV